MFRTRLQPAIREALDGTAKTQTEIGRYVGVGQPRISQWKNGNYETPPTVFQIGLLEEACDLPRGWILVRAGLVTFEAMLAADPTIADRYRRGLLAAYRKAQGG